MGWTTNRPGSAGKPRYRACYRDARGRTRSAGRPRPMASQNATRS